jgi:hypothetical protein
VLQIGEELLRDFLGAIVCTVFAAVSVENAVQGDRLCEEWEVKGVRREQKRERGLWSRKR